MTISHDSPVTGGGIRSLLSPHRGPAAARFQQAFIEVMRRNARRGRIDEPPSMEEIAREMGVKASTFNSTATMLRRHLLLQRGWAQRPDGRYVRVTGPDDPALQGTGGD